MFYKPVNQYMYQSCWLSSLFFIVFLFLTQVSYSQPSVPKPVFQNFRPLNLPGHQIQSQGNFQQKLLSNPSLSNLDPSIQAQNLVIMQRSGMEIPGQPSRSRQQQIDELQGLVNEERNENSLKIQRFQHYLTLFLQLNSDSFSITKAVYLSEASYYDNCPPYEQFEKAIKLKAGIVKQVLKQEGLSINNGPSVHYAIQKLFSQDNRIHDKKSGKEYLVKKIRYDFDDFNGENDWTKMFVSKVLKTNSGQCHSLPLLYLCIAEQLHVKAYLSLAPNHSFIQFFDSKGGLHNFETTNGHTVSTSWLLQSDAISVTAYKNKTYLDTLSSRKLFAECLADFQMCYIIKNGYDDFSVGLSPKILAIDSTNLNALMINANVALYHFFDTKNAFGNPPQEQWAEFPQLEKAYNNMVASQSKVNATGYQDMPEEQYKSWLRSIEKEKLKNNSNKK